VEEVTEEGSEREVEEGVVVESGDVGLSFGEMGGG